MSDEIVPHQVWMNRSAFAHSSALTRYGRRLVERESYVVDVRRSGRRIARPIREATFDCRREGKLRATAIVSRGVYLHTAGVAGSSPTAPTNARSRYAKDGAAFSLAHVKRSVRESVCRVPVRSRLSLPSLLLSAEHVTRMICYAVVGCFLSA